MRFEFATATRIVFGPGTLGELGPAAAEMLDAAQARRALVVTGLTPEASEPVLAVLGAQHIDCLTLAVGNEPTTGLVREGTAQAQRDGCGLIVGFGGGSALDAGKAIAALVTNGGDPLDYLEVIGRGRPLVKPSLPYMAVPTTAGTGAEVTRNAVLVSPEHQVKVSLRSPLMLPRLALVDPELTYSLPPALTASTGLDALTQLIEPYVSSRANPMIDALCREGIGRVARSLHRAYASSDPEARVDMSLASLFGGLALANAGLGAVHGFAAPLGGMFPAPHGAVCAALLAQVMDVNLRAIRERAPESPALLRYEEIARLLTGRDTAAAADGIAWVQQTCARLHVPPLRTYGVTATHFDALAAKAAAASSMRANPIQLTADEMRQILIRAL